MCMGSASIICCPYSAALVLNQKSPGQESMHRMQTAPAQTSPSTRKSLVKLFYAISVLSVLSVMSIGFDDQMWLANTKPSLCNFRGGEGHDGPARAIWVRRCEMDLGFSSVCSSKILLLFSYVTALQPVSLNSQELCMCVYYIYIYAHRHTYTYVYNSRSLSLRTCKISSGLPAAADIWPVVSVQPDRLWIQLLRNETVQQCYNLLQQILLAPVVGSPAVHLHPVVSLTRSPNMQAQ